jgi:glycosyltransferase involved in cell wall biosynthesis
MSQFRNKFVEEIVIMDTGSTDNTKGVALEFTDKVYDFQWIDDFSAARNAAFEKAMMDYILWLDADDILHPGDAINLTNSNAHCRLMSTQFIWAIMPHSMTRADPPFLTAGNALVKRSCGFAERSRYTSTLLSAEKRYVGYFD